jgi:hypothetical protein
MKRKFIIFCFIVTGLAFQMQARNYKGMSLGANAAYNNYERFDFEGFAQANFKFGRIPFEPKLGLAYRSFTTDYKRFPDLDIKSAGLFLGTDIYPFKKIFYTGIHLELDFNWFDKNTVNMLSMANEYVTRVFPGFRFHAVAGFDFPVSERISLRLSGMPGWQYYVISDNWEVSSGGGSINITSRNGVSFSRFVYQINAGIALRLWKK